MSKRAGTIFRTILVWLLAFTCCESASAEEPQTPVHPRITVDLPSFILKDVSIDEVSITLWNADGTVDSTFNEPWQIHGLKLVERNPHTGEDHEVMLPDPVDGTLLLSTDRSSHNRRLYVRDNQISVQPGDEEPVVYAVTLVPGWLSLIPPAIAILLAICLKDVFIALLAGLFGGAVVLAHGDFATSFLRTIDTHILGALTDADHMTIVLFTLFLGSMIGLMSASGGTAALVHSLARVTKTREQGQILTWLMGLVVFFDDYANTLLAGGTMRSVADRLKFSRQKLAFLVDSTAAPIAGLAIISTWVGVEVEYIQTGYDQVFGNDIQWDAYSLFLQSVWYRFYPLLLLLFVFLIAYTGRDFGPMLRAEQIALTTNDHRDNLEASDRRDQNSEVKDNGGRDHFLMWNAIVPVISLIAMISIGLWWTGKAGLDDEQPATLGNILSAADSYTVLLVSSFSASLIAFLCAFVSRSLTVAESGKAWIDGGKSMFTAFVVLVLAWGIATICNAEHLNTASYLVELMQGILAPQWMPAAAFLLAAAVSFATGSSWSTMGLLMPLLIPVTFYLLAEGGDVVPDDPILLATVGAVLAGSIFGDHCSPISDTTVLSSAATGCDHLDHVATQFPYAMVVAGVALLTGYLPAGYGIPVSWLLPLGVVAIVLVVRFVGRHPVDKCL